jgi:hypothetical protein
MAPVKPRNRIALLAAGLAGLLTLGGCTTDGYGYGGIDAGYGRYAYNDGFYDPYYGPGYYGGGYGGWYNDFYYPGGGYYVYDRRGARHRWTDQQRRYWEQRRQARRGDDRGNRPGWQPGNRDRDRGPGWRNGDAQQGGRPDGWRGDRRQWQRNAESPARNAQPRPNAENRGPRNPEASSGGFRQRGSQARPMTPSPGPSARMRGGRGSQP